MIESLITYIFALFLRYLPYLLFIGFFLFSLEYTIGLVKNNSIEKAPQDEVLI